MKQKKDQKKSSTKVMDVLRTVLVVVVVTIAVFMLIFTLTTRLAGNENADLLGYKIFIVESGSMRATHFAEGDIIISKVIAPEDMSKLEVGDVITYYAPNHNMPDSDPEEGKIVTHMIKRAERTSDGEPGYKTYGTTKGVEDSYVVPYSHIIGEYQFKIPFGGWFLQFFRSVPGYICCILIPFLLLILSQGISFVRTVVLYRREQNAIIAAERQKLNEEKAQAEMERLKAEKDAQKMMAELEFLRRKLSRENSDNLTNSEEAVASVEETANETPSEENDVVDEIPVEAVPSDETFADAEEQ